MTNCIERKDNYDIGHRRRRPDLINWLGRLFQNGAPAPRLLAINRGLDDARRINTHGDHSRDVSDVDGRAPRDDVMDIPKFLTLMLGPETVAQTFLEFVPMEFIQPLSKKYLRLVRMARKIFRKQNDCNAKIKVL